MILFHNDYNRTCHPKVMERLMSGADVQHPGYGMDDSCEAAAALIRKKCGNDSLAVHFLVGGTQTNLTVIAAALRPHHAVLAAETAHIHVHETGSIEATGHKIISIPGIYGKLDAKAAEKAILSQRLSEDAEHIAKPMMIYISSPTEYGTLYTLTELEELSAVCKRHGLSLFVDGARMGYGLAASENDVQLSDFARLCDVFTIGGTKVGAMFGEAVVISNPAMAEDFRYLMKQRGAMLAKGWLLGQQFEALFTDDLYFSIAKQADRQADRIRATFADAGVPLFMPGTTNQVFVTLPDAVLKKLDGAFTYAVWEKPDAENTTVRFCTSWATTNEDTDALCRLLKNLL